MPARCGQPVCWGGMFTGTGPSREDDLPRQIQIVNNAVARGVIGLVLAPDHAVALLSPVQAAIAQGIPTVIVSSPPWDFCQSKCHVCR